MATSCEFITSEASTKSWFRTKGLIDKFLKITNLPKFRTENTKWSNYAKEKYGIEGRVFSERQMLDHIQAVPNKEMFKKIDGAKNIFYQLSEETEQEVSKASPETLTKVKEAAKKMGISIQKLSDYLEGNPNITERNVNALADLVGKTVAIAEGKEGTALTEEVVHVATAMLEQSNPKLVTEMISKIGRFKIYNETLETYKGNKNYQLANGKPDIRKIKKESVDKLITQVIVNEDSQFPDEIKEVDSSMVRNWWNAILDFIRGTYRKANISIFEDVGASLLGADITGEISDHSIYYSLKEPQKEFQRKVKQTDDNIRRVTSDEKADPMLLDTEEASNWYEVKMPDGTWRKVKNRVTDRVKRWYKGKFFNKQFTKEEEEFNELKRTLGVKFHEYFEEIHGRYFNKDGTRKTVVEDRPSIENRIDSAAYLKLEEYFTDLVNEFSEDGKSPLVFSEVILYDENKDEAGTIDLLIVEEDGTANIFDWKFMTVSKNSNDIPWFKKGAYNVQLGRYKSMLFEKYGIKKMGMNRAIPILFNFRRNYKKEGNPVTLRGLNVGSVDVDKIKDLTLLPVSEKSETTGLEKLDKVIAQLNSVVAQISKTQATTEEQKAYKAQRLNLLEKTIRVAHAQGEITPLVSTIREISKEGKMLINDYNTIYKGKPFTSEDFNNLQLSEFAEKILEYLAVTDVFSNITTHIGKMIYDKDNPPKDKEEAESARELLSKIKEQEDNIRESKEEVLELTNEFADNFIGKRNSEDDLLSPEAIVKGIGSTFRGVSELPLASLRVLYRLATNAKGKADRDSLEDTDKIMDIRTRLLKRGGDIRKLVQQIYQKDSKNKIINKLIYKYDRKFYDAVDNNALEVNQDKTWLKNNIDIEAYEKEAFAIMNKNISNINNKYDGYPDIQEQLIDEERQKWDINNPKFKGWSNYVIKRHPLSKWQSAEYNELKKDPELLELYELIVGINERAKDVGYIQNKVASTFLPFVRKSFAESLAWNLETSAVKNFGSNLKIDAATVGYGSVNELTGELEHSVPKYFTSDFSRNEDGTNDYSDVSEDLFRNMILYSSHMNKYKYMTEIEGQLKLVKDIEQFKQHLVTSRTGEVQFDENNNPKIESGNKENAKMFDDFLRGVLYEQKYPLSDSDIAINTGVRNFMKKAVNKVAGTKVFKDTDKPSAISLMKSFDTVNRAFQLKTLGFEFISGAVNIFGGNIQVATQAGNYFKAREFAKNETKLIGNRFKNDDERNAFIQLVDTFMPLKDDPSYEKLKAAGLSPLTRTSFSDTLMMFMRLPEQHLEKSVFLTLLQNMMVENGKIVSIREYVKAKYPARLTSSTAYKEAKDKIETEIAELKETRSIQAIKKLEDGKLVIPGLDLSNKQELQRLTALTRRISRNATGGTADLDLNMASMSIWLKSMMVFKMWIPKLLDTRFSHFRQVSDDFSMQVNEDGVLTGEKYDIGRVRLWFYVMGTSIRDRSTNVINLIEMNQKGIALINKMYEDYADDYRKSTGKELKMSKEDFADLIRNNLRNQMKELAILVSLMGVALSMGMMTPPDDADKATKNFYRFSMKVVDKFKSELMFFYNPAEFGKMLSGSTFPALGLFNDITRFTEHFVMQTTGMKLSDPDMTHDEVVEKAQPVKYFSKMLPITKSMMTYGAIFSSDFAEEFDITIQQHNMR